jgi:Trk K+ transport system NAD-binding subunit
VPADSRYAGKPLAQIDFPAGARVGAIVRPDGSVVIPDAATQLRTGDRAVIFAREEAVRLLESTVLTEGRSSRWLL